MYRVQRRLFLYTNSETFPPICHSELNPVREVLSHSSVSLRTKDLTFHIAEETAMTHKDHCILQSFYRSADALSAVSDYLPFFKGPPLIADFLCIIRADIASFLPASITLQAEELFQNCDLLSSLRHRTISDLPSRSAQIRMRVPLAHADHQTWLVRGYPWLPR